MSLGRYGGAVSIDFVDSSKLLGRWCWRSMEGRPSNPRWWRRWLPLSVHLHRPFDKSLHLLELQGLFDAEARLKLGPPSVFHILLDLCDPVACFADSLLADPTRHDLGPAVPFQKSHGRRLVGVGAYNLAVDVLPVVFARAELPGYLEVQVVVLFFGFDCSCSLDGEACDA
jgi:hypothetical protein